MLKVKITKLYFDGLRRHRAGSVINISDEKYKSQDEIPKSSNKKVGDYKEFAPSCMELVDIKTPVVDLKRPIISSTTLNKADEEVI